MITKLKGYTAEAEILGEIHSVEYTEVGALTIHGLDLSAAGAVLSRLSDKSIAAVALPGAPTPSVTGGSNGATERKPGDVATPPLPDSLLKKLDTAKTDHANAQSAGQSGLPGIGTVPPTAKPAEPPPPPPATAAPPAPPAAEPPPVDAPPEIINAQRLLEIVSYLKDKQGLKTAEEILAACVKYRTASPVLQRASNLEDRIKKMLEM